VAEQSDTGEEVVDALTEGKREFAGSFEAEEVVDVK
jgi:hypothetical protein